MKLLCVIPSYWPAYHLGGPIVSVHSLNKALVKKGIDLTVYTTNTGLNDQVPVNQEVDVDGVRVIYFNIIKMFEFLSKTGWQFSLAMTRALKDNLDDFDLVYINSIWNFTTSSTAFFCRKYNIPYILAPRGMLYKHTMKKNAWKKWPYYILLTKQDIKSSAAIHYLTYYEKNKSIAHIGLNSNSIVIPNGIDLLEFNEFLSDGRLRERYPYLKDKKIVLFLGRVHWIKGLDILIKAYSRIAREINNIHLIIAGPDKDGYGKKVRQFIKEGAMSEYVTFTGMLIGREKVEVLRGSDIFVLPSYSEGFSMSILEAMFFGMPVVITHQCNFPEVERSNAGYIVNPDADSLYLALKKLIDNPQKAQDMGIQGQKLATEAFSINKIADKMIKSFYDVIS